MKKMKREGVGAKTFKIYEILKTPKTRYRNIYIFVNMLINTCTSNLMIAWSLGTDLSIKSVFFSRSVHPWCWDTCYWGLQRLCPPWFVFTESSETVQRFTRTKESCPWKLSVPHFLQKICDSVKHTSVHSFLFWTHITCISLQTEICNMNSKIFVFIVLILIFFIH